MYISCTTGSSAYHRDFLWDLADPLLWWMGLVPGNLGGGNTYDSSQFTTIDRNETGIWVDRGRAGQWWYPALFLRWILIAKRVQILSEAIGVLKSLI